jgi:hypothetical protein
MVRVLLVVSFLVLVACDENAKSNERDNTVKSQDLTKINAKAIESLNYTDYALSEDAETIINQWEKYQELSIQINYLKKGDLSFFNSDKELLVDFIKELKDNIPESLQTRPISSRVTLVETFLLKLNDDLTLSNIKVEDKLESIKAVLESFSNLNFQINKNWSEIFLIVLNQSDM